MSELVSKSDASARLLRTEGLPVGEDLLTKARRLFNAPWDSLHSAQALLSEAKCFLGLPYARLPKGATFLSTPQGVCSDQSIDCFTTSIALLERLKAFHPESFSSLEIPHAGEMAALFGLAIEAGLLREVRDVDSADWRQSGMVFQLRSDDGLIRRGKRHLMFYVNQEELQFIHCSRKHGFVIQDLDGAKLERRIERGRCFIS